MEQSERAHLRRNGAMPMNTLGYFTFIVPPACCRHNKLTIAAIVAPFHPLKKFQKISKILYFGQQNLPIALINYYDQRMLIGLNLYSNFNLKIKFYGFAFCHLHAQIQLTLLDNDWTVSLIVQPIKLQFAMKDARHINSWFVICVIVSGESRYHTIHFHFRRLVERSHRIQRLL